MGRIFCSEKSDGPIRAGFEPGTPRSRVLSLTTRPPYPFLFALLGCHNQKSHLNGILTCGVACVGAAHKAKKKKKKKKKKKTTMIWYQARTNARSTLFQINTNVI